MATAEVPYKEKKATYSGVSHSVSRCCKFNASTTKHYISPNLDLLVARSQVSARLSARSGEALPPAPGSGSRRWRSTSLQLQLRLADTLRLLLPQPSAGARARAPTTEAISGTC